MRFAIFNGAGGGGRVGGGRGVSANPIANVARRIGQFLSSGRGGRLVSQIANAIQGAFRG